MSMTSALSALLALALVAQNDPQRVMIRDFAADRMSVAAAEKAMHAILRQLGSRPDLIAFAEPEDPNEPADADLVLDAGVSVIRSGYLGVVIASDAASGRPKTAESCRSADENGLAACMLEAANRVLRGEDPAPVGRAGGTIAINTLDAYGIKENVARNATGVVRVELQKVGGLRVVAEGADWEVRGTVGRLDETWLVHLVLLDPDKKIAHRISEVFKGPQRELVQAAQIAARRLVGIGGDETGAVAVRTNVSEGRLSIDGGAPQPIAREQKLTLSPGKHHVEVTADGHHPVGREFYVLPGQTTTLQTSLPEIPEPWYEKWWVWTAIGAAVTLSATVVAVAAANQPEDALIEVRVR